MRRRLLVLLWGLAALGIGLVASMAGAATVPSAITSVTVSAPSVPIGERLHIDLTYSLPNSTSTGDTFTLQLPDELGHDFPGFDLLAPDGSVVARAATSSTGLVTFTVTDYVETHDDVSGTAFFQTTWNRNLVHEGDDVDLTFTSDGTTFHDPTTVGAGPAIDRTGSRKYGTFTNPADEGKTTPGGAVSWVVEAPIGPADLIRFEDALKPGQTNDCASITPEATKTVQSNGSALSWKPVTDGRFTVVSCTSTAIVVTFSNVASGELVRIRYTTTITDPSLASYQNTANIFVDGVKKATASTLRRSDAGGDGVGVTTTTTIATTTTTEATTTTTAATTTTTDGGVLPSSTSTTAPSTTTSAPAATTTTVAQTTTTTQPAAVLGETVQRSTTVATLPRTGSNTGSTALLGLVALSTGGALTVAGKRRQRPRRPAPQHLRRRR